MQCCYIQAWLWKQICRIGHHAGLKSYTYWLATPCFPFLSFWQLLLYSLLQWVWLYLIPHIRGFIHYISSFFWLISLGISSRLLHVVSYGRISFFLRKDNNSLCVCVVCVCVYIYTHYSLSITSSADGHLGCYHIKATVSTAEMKLEVLMFSRSWFRLCWINTKCEMGKSYDNSMFSIFNFCVAFIFFIMIEPFCHPTNRYKGSLHLHNLTKVC